MRIILSITLILLISCNSSLSSLEEYYRYINDPDNRIIHTREINGFKLIVKYLPPELLALREFDNKDQKLFSQELIDEYSNSIHFLVTISLADEQNQNQSIRFFNVHNQTELQNRQYLLNYQLGGYFRLTIGDKEFKPQLFSVDNDNGVSNSIKISIAFVAEDGNSAILSKNDMELSFFDPIYETGITNYFFRKSDIQSIPDLKIL